MQNYVVGFQIFDARNLQTDDGQTCDPYVVVECCGKYYRTKTECEKTQYVSYQEKLIWPDIQLYPEEFESAYIEFSVYARRFIYRDPLIGKASLQLKSINARMGHVYAKRPLLLRQPESTENNDLLI